MTNFITRVTIALREKKEVRCGMGMEAVKVSDSLISRDRTVNRRKSCEVHYHDEHELYYMQEGRTTYFIDNEIFGVEKGDFVFVPRGILHRTDSGDCRKNTRILLNFPDDVFDGKAGALYQALCAQPVFGVSEDRLLELEGLFWKIEREYKGQGAYGEILTYSYITELLALLCRCRRQKKPGIQESDRIIYEITSYIGENYGQDISLQKIARSFSISQSYLSRKFKAVTGIGLNRYITYVRMSNAEKLLRRGGMSVARTAVICGYNDTNYFSMVFKRIHGVTPFRMVRNGEDAAAGKKAGKV